MDLPLDITSDESDRCTEVKMQERERSMAEALLSEKRATFSCVGAMHALGIQNCILEKIPQEQAISSFYFVNIYRDQPINEYEAKLREKAVFHPLEIQFFDAKIMNSIIQNAKRLEKINQLYASGKTEDPESKYWNYPLDFSKEQSPESKTPITRRNIFFSEKPAPLVKYELAAALICGLVSVPLFFIEPITASFLAISVLVLLAAAFYHHLQDQELVVVSHV